jgi:hypothetical protein
MAWAFAPTSRSQLGGAWHVPQFFRFLLSRLCVDLAIMSRNLGQNGDSPRLRGGLFGAIAVDNRRCEYGIGGPCLAFINTES